MGKADRIFVPGKLTTLLDAGAGSSGKGKLASWLAENADNWQFACNTFAPQAGHWVRLLDGRQFFYQSLNSCAYLVDKYEKIYIGAGSIIELPALLREIEENRVPIHKLGISPMAAILSEEDAQFEKGLLGFDGVPLWNAVHNEGTAKFGSTCHGVGSVMARRALRRPSLKLARDIEVLKPYLCNVQDEIYERLRQGQAGLLELAQGFQLSLLNSDFYPNVTSRQVTVAQGFADMFLPTTFAGPIVLNLRTFPIRINSNKYIGLDGEHLTWQQVQDGVPHTVYKGNSGNWYDDQVELTWEELTQYSGSTKPIMEMTSVTKLPRRVATFSQKNLADAIKYNFTGHEIFTSINFMNYVDVAVQGKTSMTDLTEKCRHWLNSYIPDWRLKVNMIGTGMNTEEMIWNGDSE